MAIEPWTPLGVPNDQYDSPRADGRRWLHLSLRKARGDSGRAPGSALITAATVLLGLLAVGLFVVSLAAQYAYLIAERHHQRVPSAIEAVGLDVGMAIFSLLALGLAMADQSARIERPGRNRKSGLSKTSRFVQLVEDRHGPLAAIDPAHVSRIAADLAPEVGLNAGSARSALRPLVLAAQMNGHAQNRHSS